MNLYAILRRNGWATPGDLGEAAKRSSDVGDNQMSDDIRWIRSYVLDEEDGSVGTICIYHATSPEKIREHASRADLPVIEIIPIADTVLVRPDPEPAQMTPLDALLREAFPEPAEVQVVDRTGGGDHFQVTVVSEQFAGLSLVEQHKLVYAALAEPLADGTIHELRISTKTEG